MGVDDAIAGTGVGTAGYNRPLHQRWEYAVRRVDIADPGITALSNIGPKRWTE